MNPIAAPAKLRLVVLGLSLSSSWGNGHATTWRALLRAFSRLGHEVLFLERETSWYRDHRDDFEPFCRLEFYRSLAELERWADEVAAADAVMLGSFVPEGRDAARWLLEHARGVRAFYDIDTPVTLAALERGDCEYISGELIGRFDVYLSFTGGPILGEIERRYGAPAARALYCSVDAELYRPVATPVRWDLSYLGTYSADRQRGLDRLLLAPARGAPELKFCVAGPLYPAGADWPANVERIEHVSPAEHRAFYGSSRFTLNLTRAHMAAAGFSPSVRLFEAAACGAPIISDPWEGLSGLFDPRSEIFIAEHTDTVLDVLRRTDESRRQDFAGRARARVLAAHTARTRAGELETHLRAAMAARPGQRPAAALSNPYQTTRCPSRTGEAEHEIAAA